MNFKEEIKMRIQHNIAALNSYRQLSGNNSAVSKNLEKLSSGYRINRAGDDAAGLAISEKMRAQITGLETAQKNANDGISLVQTAEGALTEVHSMLNRMVELATQSANGTYDNSVDRANLQKEFDSLLEEVDRISEATNFNGINLLDGSLGGAKVASTTGTASAVAGAKAAVPTVDGTFKYTSATEGTATVQATFEVEFKGMAIKAPTDGSTGAKATFSIAGETIEIDVAADMTDHDIADAVAAKITTAGGQNGTATVTGTKITFTAAAAGETTTIAALNGTTGKGTGKAGTLEEGKGGSASEVTLDFDGRAGGDFLGGTVKIGDKTYAFVEQGAATPAGADGVITISKSATSEEVAAAVEAAMTADATYEVARDGMKVTLTEKAKTADKPEYSGKAIGVEFKGTGLRLQVGDTDDDFQKVRVAVGDMSTKGLGLDALKNVGIADQTTAGTSVDKIKQAINSVSSTRGDLGAIQNRLEHTINNLGVTTENMTAAESRIRDTDMAKEMMAYTKNNILVQAAQAMLAQANQVPQGVLQLLQ